MNNAEEELSFLNKSNWPEFNSETEQFAFGEQCARIIFEQLIDISKRNHSTPQNQASFILNRVSDVKHLFYNNEPHGKGFKSQKDKFFEVCLQHPVKNEE